ncbi:MAG: TraB/GumN family protein [Paracoccaceae bacterium]
MLRAALAALFLTLPGVAIADCAGQSLLGTLAAADRATLDAAVAAVPYPTGNAWRATRDGKTVTIVGTYHLEDPRHDTVLNALAPLLDAAAVVLVEAGPEEQAALAQAVAERPELLFRTKGPTLPETLQEAEWQMLAGAMKERGIPGFMAAKMQPWYVSVLLAVPPCAMPDMTQGAAGLDHKIMLRAAAQNIPIRALEPYDAAFRIFDEMDDATQLDMVRLSLALEERAEDMNATLADAYFNENARMIWEFGRLMSYQVDPRSRAEIDAEYAEMEELLMARRNRNWIPVIEASLDDGPVFAAFGALHLSGEDGVLALLAREGFTLERLPFAALR